MTRYGFFFGLIGVLTVAASCTDIVTVDWNKIEDPNADESGGAGGEAGQGGEGGAIDAAGAGGEPGNEGGSVGAGGEAGATSGGNSGSGGTSGTTGSGGSGGTAGTSAGGSTGGGGTSGAAGKGGSSGSAGTVGAGGSSGASGTGGSGGTGGVQSPGCGDGLPDPEELCDPPFSVNDCGSDCKAITSAECSTCEEMGDCLEFMDCSALTGNAAQGPAQGTPKAQLCNEVLDCVRDTGCAAGLLVDCYCGNVATPHCDAGQGNGDCRAQLERGLETLDPAQIQARFTQYLSYGGGLAMTRVNCDASICPDSCF